MVECWDWRGLQWSGGNHFVIPRSWAAVGVVVDSKFPILNDDGAAECFHWIVSRSVFWLGIWWQPIAESAHIFLPHSIHQQPGHFRPISPRQEQGFLAKIFRMYCTAAPADHPHALLCVELCVSAEVHHTAHSSGSLDTCLRQKIVQSSVSLHVNSQDSGVTTKVLLSTWPQFISNNITTSLQSNNS